MERERDRQTDNTFGERERERERERDRQTERETQTTPFGETVSQTDKDKGEKRDFSCRIIYPGSSITNGRERRSCLGHVFNFKSCGCTDNTKIAQPANAHI